MKLEFLIWSNGDPLVGEYGVSYKATFDISPEIDFETLDAEDAKAFKASMEDGIKKVIRNHAEYFDDKSINIATPEEINSWED